MRTLGARAGRVAAAVAIVAAVAACSLPSLGSGDDESSDTLVDHSGGSWQEQAAAIEGILIIDPNTLSTEHVDGPVEYDLLPPVGGPHHDYWQRCDGVVYDEQIPNEHAVHSLEHGAVWVTYHPSLPQDQVALLADQVSGGQQRFLSPFPALDAPISLQTWGYQLKVDRADDRRIAEFIRVLEGNAGPEPHGPCHGGVEVTGAQPVPNQ